MLRAMTTVHVRRMLIIAAGLIAGVMTTGTPVDAGVAAQQVQTRRFDVISIKRNTNGVLGGTTQNQPGRFIATNISLRMLIRNAYGLLESQIVSGPQLATAQYMTAEKFDVEATFAGDATPEERAVMMRNLLADRFKVVTHREMRDMPVYILSKSRPDGRIGPQLTVTNPADCDPATAPRAPAADIGPQRCGSLQFGPGTFSGKGARIQMLAESLSNRTPLTGIDRYIVDRTGLSANERYDFQLKWRPPPAPAGLLPPGVSAPAVDPDRPDLFTALQEQLGLKLEPQRAAIEVLIIDSAEMPAEN
jgi:uncharacterized protein (TIGR03435 family)